MGILCTQYFFTINFVCRNYIQRKRGRKIINENFIDITQVIAEVEERILELEERVRILEVLVKNTNEQKGENCNGK